MRVALIHDYLSQDGGAERVLKALHEMWPEAPVFVLFHDKEKIPYINPDKIQESALTKFPYAKTAYQWYLPWMPLLTEHHDLRDFDVVISSSSVFAKGVITPPNTLHICYCHTPPRFLWADTHQYLADLKYNFLIKSLLPGAIHRMRLWDKMSADRVDHFIANSKTVAQRINKYYRRNSDVIYPPIESSQFNINKNIGEYYLAGGRLVPYKRLDIVVKTFNRLRWPLKIFGTGPEEKSLRRIARNNIEFLGHVNEDEKAELFARARAYIHPQIEDCGMTAIESMASGRPVVAYCEGGATETVLPNETGLFFHKQNWESLFDTLLRFDPFIWDAEKIRTHALQFDVENFKQKITSYVNDRHEEFKKGFNQPTLLK